MRRNAPTYRRRLTNLEEFKKLSQDLDSENKDFIKIEKLRKANIQLKEEHKRVMGILVKVQKF
jgi:hypothetical protein